MYRSAMHCITAMLVVLMAVMAVPAGSHAANSYPIILVHAWSQQASMLSDIEDALNVQGYETYTPAMGPFSSTWDRACELYAQIKGGTVDYGLYHSRKFGHARYGRTYPGMWPKWGTTDPATGKLNRVHFVGYCYGGLTERMLIQLLAKGDAKERSATAASVLSPLFAGNHPWTLSCTSIVTPHDGSSVFDEAFLNGLANTDIIKLVLRTFSPVLDEGSIYDLQLDQWGFCSKPGEVLSSLILRLSLAPFWINNKDFSNYDIMPYGVYTMNSWVKAQPNVYYFSLGADASYKGIDGHYHPILTQIPLTWGLSEYIGSHVRYTLPFFVTSKWWPNDGTVNTISQNGPKVCSNTKDAIVAYTGTPQVGKWNYLGTVKNVDHFQIVYSSLTYDATAWFLSHAKFLRSLPL